MLLGARDFVELDIYSVCLVSAVGRLLLGGIHSTDFQFSSPSSNKRVTKELTRLKGSLNNCEHSERALMEMISKRKLGGF